MALRSTLFISLSPAIGYDMACMAFRTLAKGFDAGFYIASFNVDDAATAADGWTPLLNGYSWAGKEGIEALALYGVGICWWMRGKMVRGLGLGCGYVGGGFLV